MELLNMENILLTLLSSQRLLWIPSQWSSWNLICQDAVDIFPELARNVTDRFNFRQNSLHWYLSLPRSLTRFFDKFANNHFIKVIATCEWTHYSWVSSLAFDFVYEWVKVQPHSTQSHHNSYYIKIVIERSVFSASALSM